MTFGIPHVFKALQMLSKERFVSRSSFSKELQIGEGAVKTLIAHLKEHGIADTTRAGTFLTTKGKSLTHQLIKIVPKECFVEKCKIAQGEFNHAVLLKNFANFVTTGLEQRDFAIIYGSSGCITLQYFQDKFVFPKDRNDCLKHDIRTKNTLLKKLEPDEGDVIIISSSDDKFVAEISAKNAALWTMATN